MNALLCLLLLMPAELDRAQAEKDFRAANERALEGDLAGAIGLYEALIDDGVEDADVWFNLGNAHARSGEPVEAIVAYEKALRLTPGDEEILANLRFVRGKLTEREEVPAESLTFADAVEPMVAPLDPVLFGWIAGGANVLLFGLWWLRRRSTRGRRATAAGMGVAAAVLSVGLSVVAGHVAVAKDPRGVVVQEVELKEGPHPRYKSKGAAIHGGRIRILEEAEGYLEVLQSDGTTGWLPAKAVVRV